MYLLIVGLAIAAYLYADMQVTRYNQRSVIYTEMEKLKRVLSEAVANKDVEKKEQTLLELDFLEDVYCEVNGWHKLNEVRAAVSKRRGRVSF